MHQDRKHSESGNALWFILLAIALLVALTITITRSGENTEQLGDRDRNRVEASDILRQAKGIAAAVDQMRLNGIPENNISFANSTVTGYDNAKCTDGSCLLFGSAGGGLSYKIPSSTWLDQSESAKPLFGEWYFYSAACVPGVGSGGTGCSADAANSELIVALPWVNLGLCIEINRMVGITNLTGPTRPPEIATTAYPTTLDKYAGTFVVGSEINNVSDSFKGKQTGCFEGSGGDPDGGYHFYQVVLPR